MDSKDTIEPVQEMSEPKKAEEKIEEAQLPENDRTPKENVIRRKKRARGRQNSLPKAILKRQKALNYRTWAVPASVMVVLVLLWLVLVILVEI